MRALDTDLPAMLAEAGAAKAGSAADTIRANWRTLSNIRLVSPQSTAPATQLAKAAGLECPDGADCLEKIFTKKLGDLHEKLGADHKVPEPPPSFFIRTIGTDDLLITRLVNELRIRGANPCKSGRGQILRTLLIVLFTWFLDYTWVRVVDVATRIGDEYFPNEPGASEAPRPGRMKRILLAVPNLFILLWRPNVVLVGGGIDGSRLWSEYRLRLHNWPRFGRLALSVIVLAILLLLVNEAIGGSIPVIPVRGIGDREVIGLTMYLHGLAVASLVLLVGDATILTWRFITVLRRGRTVYPRATVRHFAAELGPDLRDAAARPIMPQIIDREAFLEADAKPATHYAAVQADGSPHNSLLDDWIDVRLLAEHTAAIGPLIVVPFILLALMVVARSQLFDNWQFGGSVMFVLVLYVLLSVGSAILLNFGAEVARRRAIDRMEADLLWLQGAGPGASKLAERFPTVIEQVRNMRKGAFAPFFQQPLVQAILVPLGGAGGVQLMEFLLYGRMQ